MALFNYECDEVKRIIEEVSPNYPQLTTYEKEWLYFHKYGYIPGVPVELEYETVNVNPTGHVSNAIPHQYKRAILKGQTLVNITSDKKIVGSAYIRVEVDNNLIKPNVQYTLIVNGYSNVSRISCVDNNGLNPYFNITNPKQWNIFTTPNDLTNRHIRVYGTSIDDTLLNSIDIILIEGDYTNINIPYFEGMKSVQMPVLTTVGKNLFDIDTMVTKNATVENGVVTKAGNVSHTLPMLKITNLEVGKTYTLSCDYSCSITSDGGILIYCLTYDDGNYSGAKDNIKISTNNITRIKETFVAKKDVVYLIGSIGKTYISNIQLEQGSQPTSHEPYKSNILTVNEEVELGSVGDVKDELNLLTGELTQRIGEVVFDGSDDERWWYAGHSDTIIRFNTTINMMWKTQILCSDIQVDTPNIGAVPYQYEGIANHAENYIYLYLKKEKFENYSDDLSNADKCEMLKDWLTKNSITIKYRLATESIKTIDLAPLNRPYEGTNHYHITANIPCEAILEVPVVSTGKQTLEEINN